MKPTIIEIDALKDITERIKVVYPNWTSIIAQYISKDKDWKNYTNNPCTENNARHISSGTIKSQLHRRIYMKAAAQMLAGVAEDNKEIETLISQVS